MTAENRTKPASGDLYGRYVGRWSRLTACDFLACLDLSARPSPRAVNIGAHFPFRPPEALVPLLEDAGRGPGTARAVDVPTTFADSDGYWSPMLRSQAPGPDSRVRVSEAQRSALRERLRARLPFAPDGRIALIARAFAVRGAVPAT